MADRIQPSPSRRTSRSLDEIQRTEDPAIHADRKKQELDFAPPVDIVDGAARVCDPFFSGLLTGEHFYGKFLKDYKPANW